MSHFCSSNGAAAGVFMLVGASVVSWGFYLEA